MCALKRNAYTCKTYDAYTCVHVDTASRLLPHICSLLTQGSEMGSKQMAALFPAIMAAFKSDVDEVALPLLPFMHAYIARLKVLQKR